MKRSPKKSKVVFVGSIHKTNTSGSVEVLDYINSKNVLVKFLDTGHITTAQSRHIVGGSVKDWTKKDLLGVACVGDGDHKVSDNLVAYQTWKHMLQRCYDKGNYLYPRYGGRGVFVCEAWLNFQTFVEWYKENYREGFQLDKDLVCLGNKEYCPEMCRFIPHRVNALLTFATKSRGDYPLGVTKQGGKYVVRCSDGAGNVLRGDGCYEEPDQAFREYKRIKEGVIKSVAEEEYREGSIPKEIFNNLMGFEVIPFPD